MSGLYISGRILFQAELGGYLNTFHFYKYDVKKMLKGKLKPIKLEELNNVIIDTNNVFYLPDYHESIYPYVFSVHDGSIADAYVLQ